MTNIAELIRGARLDRGWSQEHLAERANLHINTIHKIEQGHNHPSNRTLAKLNSVLGINDYNYR